MLRTFVLYVPLVIIFSIYMHVRLSTITVFHSFIFFKKNIAFRIFLCFSFFFLNLNKIFKKILFKYCMYNRVFIDFSFMFPFLQSVRTKLTIIAMQNVNCTMCHVILMSIRPDNSRLHGFEIIPLDPFRCPYITMRILSYLHLHTSSAHIILLRSLLMTLHIVQM